MRPFTVALLGLLPVSTLAWAHPLSRDTYSLRTAVRLEEARLDAVVVLEIPYDVVMGDIKAKLDAASAARDRTSARAVVTDYAKAQFAALDAGLTLTVDGKAVPGSWVRKESPYNGKGAVSEGFFLYIVTFEPSGGVPLDEDVTVAVTNTAYAEAPMVHSAWAFPGEGWTVRSHSAQALLPEGSYNPNEAAWWTTDASLRAFSARVVRAP